MGIIDDDPDIGPYRFGTDNAWHTAEREAEQAALQAIKERFGLRLSADLATLSQSPRDPSERARARIALLERENATLRREVFAVGTHRERELIDLRVEVRRLQRQGHDVETLARSLRARGRVEPSPPPASLKPRVPPEVQRRYAKAEAERLEQERVAKDMVGRLEQRMRDRERFGPEAFEADDRL